MARGFPSPPQLLPAAVRRFGVLLVATQGLIPTNRVRRLQEPHGRDGRHGGGADVPGRRRAALSPWGGRVRARRRPLWPGCAETAGAAPRPTDADGT